METKFSIWNMFARLREEFPVMFISIMTFLLFLPVVVSLYFTKGINNVDKVGLGFISFLLAGVFSLALWAFLDVDSDKKKMIDAMKKLIKNQHDYQKLDIIRYSIETDFAFSVNYEKCRLSVPKGMTPLEKIVQNMGLKESIKHPILIVKVHRFICSAYIMDEMA